MRNLLLILCLVCGLVACNEDNEIGFDVPVEFRKVSFKPIPGGAVMHFRLPGNSDIFGVRARYCDGRGRALVKEATYLVDSLVLDGFNESVKNHPVKLTFFNNGLKESEQIEMTFDTDNAATVALFDSLTVNPYWGGFNVTYASPAVAGGTIHIFYIGINPATQQLDSILVGSYPIAEGGDTLNFVLKQALDELNVVVRTDDYEGERVKTVIYEHIDALAMEQLKPENFTFTFTGNLVEDDDRDIHAKYLFDGTKKGANYRTHYMAGDKSKEGYRQYGTFLAGPNAFGERFIIDFGEPRVPAMLCGDAFVFHGYAWPVLPGTLWPGEKYDLVGAEYWHGRYISRLPSSLKLYGTNAADPKSVPLSECTLLYSLDESPAQTNRRDTWIFYADDNYNYSLLSVKTPYKDQGDKEFEAADPVTLEMKCNYSGKKFRYVFFEVYDTYNSQRWNQDYDENGKEYVTFDELEVYVKMEKK